MLFGKTHGVITKGMCRFLTVVMAASTFLVSNPPAWSGSSFIDKDTFYYLNISYFCGGFLSDSRLIVKINNRKVNFFGDEYSNISRFGGTDTSIVNDLLVKGKNSITVEIQRVKGRGSPNDEACEFGLVLELKKKGDIVDSGRSDSALFQVQKRLDQNSFKHPLILQGEFVL